MKVSIDGQERREIPSTASPLEILEAVRAEAARSGLVLTGLQVDGVEMDERAFLALSGGMSAHFSLTPVRLLVRETLAETLSYISRLKKGIGEIADHFEEGGTSAAQNGLSEAMEGLDWTLDVYERCSTLTAGASADPEKQAFRGGLLDILNRLIGLMDGKRYPQMALVLRQEMLPSIDELALMLGRLSAPQSR